jgi:hypothetical protein
MCPQPPQSREHSQCNALAELPCTSRFTAVVDVDQPSYVSHSARSVINDTQPIWEQFRDAPVYADIEADQRGYTASDGYMEVTSSPEPYSARYEDDDDALLTVRRLNRVNAFTRPAAHVQ